MKKLNSDVFTVDEFASILKVHPNTIRRQIKQGHIQAFRTGNGKKSSYRILKTELNRMAAFDAMGIIENLVKERMEKK